MRISCFLYVRLYSERKNFCFGVHGTDFVLREGNKIYSCKILRIPWKKILD